MSADEVGRSWEFAQDDEWDVAEDIAAQMGEWGAGSVAAVLRDKQDRVIAAHGFVLIGQYEVATKFDARSGEVLWAYRTAQSGDQPGDE